MSTARAILNFDDIHENNQNAGDNADKNDDERGNQQGGNAPKEPEYCPASPHLRMQLRSRKRKHNASN